MWLATRAAALLLALGGALLLVGALPATVTGYLQLWDRWDVELFRKIAEFGYDGYPADYPDPGIVAFFPGLPLVLAAATFVDGDLALRSGQPKAAASSYRAASTAFTDGGQPHRAASAMYSAAEATSAVGAVERRRR